MDFERNGSAKWEKSLVWRGKCGYCPAVQLNSEMRTSAEVNKKHKAQQKRNECHLVAHVFFNQFFDLLLTFLYVRLSCAT
jgi:hypothetical protein